MSTDITQTVCSPWASVTDLPTDAAAPPAPYTWAQVLLAASETLYALSGRQWRSVGHSRVQIVRDSSAAPESALLPGWVPWPLTGSVLPPTGWAPEVTAPGAWWGRERPVVVALPSSPVRSIESVTIDGTELDAAAYALRGDRLKRVDGGHWPTEGTLRVEFTHGAPPPPDGWLACLALAQEIAVDLAGRGSNLPSKVRTLTREGVSASLTDARAGEDLDKWRTGIAAVDLFLTTRNPHRMARRARCWTPNQPRAVRVTSP